MAEQKIEFVSAIAVAYSNTAPSNTEVLWVDLSIAGDSLYDKIKAYKNGSWVLVNRNAAEILKDLKTVDGAGSGLDADTLQGLTPDQLISQSGGVPLLSSGKILVGQADSIGLAKTVSGIATIDTNGVLTLVPGSISHTELTDIGVNTHAQIDSHISDTSNPHSVTATQVGKDTAQWNADRLQGGSLNLGTPGAGQDGYGISWNNGTSSYELVPILADNISNANLTFNNSYYADLSTFSWTLGGTAPIGTEKISFQKDTLVKGSDTSSSTSGFKFVDQVNASLWDWRNNGDIYQGKDSVIYLQDNKLTFSYDVDTATEAAPLNFEFGGFWQGYTRWNEYGEVTMKTSGNGAPLTVLNKVSPSSAVFRVDREGGGYFSTNGSRLWLIADATTSTTKTEFLDDRWSQYWAGTEYHRIQTSGAGTGVYFFRTGISGSLGGFTVGGSALIGTEKISLQEDTLVGKTGSKVGFMGTAPIVKVTTGVSAGAFVANTSGIADDTATFGGYTIGQIAQALINYGLLT